jgi:hypothetical protein
VHVSKNQNPSGLRAQLIERGVQALMQFFEAMGIEGWRRDVELFEVLNEDWTAAAGFQDVECSVDGCLVQVAAGVLPNLHRRLTLEQPQKDRLDDVFSVLATAQDSPGSPIHQWCVVPVDLVEILTQGHSRLLQRRSWRHLLLDLKTTPFPESFDQVADSVLRRPLGPLDDE